MDDEDLARMFEERADAMRTAADTVNDPEARLELLRIADAYRDRAAALRERQH